MNQEHFFGKARSGEVGVKTYEHEYILSDEEGVRLDETAKKPHVSFEELLVR